MKKITILYTACLCVFIPINSYAQSEYVKIDCLEFEALIGEYAQCDMFKTLQVKQSTIDAAIKRKKRKSCIATAIEKYGEEICAASIRLYGVTNDSLEGKEDAVVACDIAVETCKNPEPEEQIKPRKTIKLW